MIGIIKTFIICLTVIEGLHILIKGQQDEESKERRTL